MQNLGEFDPSSLLEMFGTAGKEEAAAQLDRLVRFIGERRFCQEAARQLVRFTRPEIALPASLNRYAALVRDGIEFFLSAVSYPRLRRVLLNIFTMRQASEPAERLFQLALHFPTLHKLGQVVARNPRLDPAVKKWLVGLEHGSSGTEGNAQIDCILGQLAELGIAAETIDISPLIIAEASVATVLAFCCWKSASGETEKGVFKVLKPGVEDDLREELQVLATTFAFLDQNRRRYGLQEMKLAVIFAEIRQDMAREVNLEAEQAHLAEAALVYARLPGVRIPRLGPFNSPTMTSMEFIDGRRVSDIDLDQRQRLTLASSLFEAVICVPLFLKDEQALFHGDPHAGNILIIPGSGRKNPEIALLDWTLAAHLSKGQRIRVMELLAGVMKNDSRTLAGIVASLPVSEDKELNPARLAGKIESLLMSRQYLACDALKKTFLLLETMTLEGVVLPAEMILFRKAFFTLEGVLHEISLNFDMGEAMERYLAGLLLRELPQRCTISMLFAADTPEQYQSLISNSALQELTLQQAVGQWRTALQHNAELWNSQLRLMTDLFDCFAGRR